MKKLFLIAALACLTSMPVCGQTHKPQMTQGAVAMGCVSRLVNYQHLTSDQYDALVDFTFNVGCGHLAKSTLLRKLNAGDVNGAYNEFDKWTYVGKVQLRGLKRRRDAEKAMWRGNE